MNESSLTITSPSDELSLQLYRWLPDSEPRALVQIAHGMGEHAARYRRVAQALTDAGYAVYADDHRGHGRTAGGSDQHGALGAGGWSALVADLGAVADAARAEFPGLPIGLLSHSMGSFAAQSYLVKYPSKWKAIVLSGTTAGDILAAQLDPAAPADLSAFNAPFEHRTGYEWLSRDEAEVDLYVADEACGFGLDADGTAGMVADMITLGDTGDLAAIDHALPMLVVSGSDDPLRAGDAALVELVGRRYREAGLSDVTVRIYPGARHEILNETNREEVTGDILQFFDRALQPR